jgi:hypothetical protein
MSTFAIKSARTERRCSSSWTATNSAADLNFSSSALHPSAPALGADVRGSKRREHDKPWRYALRLDFNLRAFWRLFGALCLEGDPRTFPRSGYLI